MKQLIQNFKTGELLVSEVPVPRIARGMVLVQNEYSLISVGTERSTVKVAKANLFVKAKLRPDLVDQVLQNIKKEGLLTTIQKVKTKLDTYKALGYSTSGIVLASLDTSGKIKPGDRVACGGQDYASHAEVISVPQNLVVKVPENVSTKTAAFTTLGAIALQGVRQAEPKIGEKFCIIGLGLLGQITCQLIRANGCSVMGIDLDKKLVNMAANLGADISINRDNPNLMAIIDHFTDGYGFDSIIITAATQSNDPIELSSEIARKKGRIVIVGSVGMDVPRDPHFYRKELDLRMSCSYGPGRYDTSYEELGNDYPYGYVRWTEKRNMEAFLNLLSRNDLKLEPLITHVFDIDDAPKAYNILLDVNTEPHIGILLKYSENQNKKQTFIQVDKKAPSEINVGLIGAGNFAQSYLIPHIKSFGGSLDGVATLRGITSKNVLDKYDFNFCTSDAKDILKKQEINTIFIATPHSSHAELAVQALKFQKDVFVEKPLAINNEQLVELIKVKNDTNTILMVGFNRRFAPISKEIKRRFNNVSDPMIINMRINAGTIHKDHWIQQPEIGGGRIVGEICHFIDLMQYFTDAEPIYIYADSINTTNDRINIEDNIAIVVRLSDGSIGNLTYLSNGDKSIPKERIEVYCAGSVGVINDFKDGAFYKDGKVSKLKSNGKGHKEEIKEFLNAILNGQNSPINFRSICLTTIATFKILDCLRTGLPQDVNLYE